MRRNKRVQNGAVIDLTSLLDVIFIILLAVMVGQKTSGIEKEQELEFRKTENQQKQDELDEKISHYDNLIETEGNAGKWVWIVSISVPYETDIHKRTISVMSEDKKLNTFALVGSDTEEAYDDFREYLEEQIKENSDSPVILALNPDNGDILYRDEKRVTEILFELSKEYKNVSIKGNTGETE